VDFCNASSGVKDDGVTRQYDLTGGTGIYLTKGGWETIQWTKGDATAPLQLTDASGKTLDVNPGKSFLAIWGGYYGQALRLLDGEGNEQALPEKPALLDSAVPDEAAEAAEQAQQHAQALADAQNKLNQAQTLVEREQWDQAEELTRQVYQDWQDSHFYLHVVMRHSDTDQILRGFRAVEQYLVLEEPDQYTAANAELICQLELLSEMEQPSLVNIL